MIQLLVAAYHIAKVFGVKFAARFIMATLNIGRDKLIGVIIEMKETLKQTGIKSHDLIHFLNNILNTIRY